MPKISWDKLAESINMYFKYPFVADGYVRAWISEYGFGKALHIQIGPRDIAIDEHGEVWATGTSLEEDKDGGI